MVVARAKKWTEMWCLGVYMLLTLCLLADPRRRRRAMREGGTAV